MPGAVLEAGGVADRIEKERETTRNLRTMALR
jgi:hypothetical protein